MFQLVSPTLEKIPVLCLRNFQKEKNFVSFQKVGYQVSLR